MSFIQKFKQTSFYKELFLSHQVLGIYLLGSRATGLEDENSDYDIVILTLTGVYEIVPKERTTTYEGKRVHWYYTPIDNLLCPENYPLKLLCPVQLRNLCKELIIYENPLYTDMINNLWENRINLSTLGIYRLFEVKKYYIESVLRDGEILKKHYTKFLYHLCLASYYLTDEEPDKEFLKAIKYIMYKEVSTEYKQLAVERLKIYKSYIEQNPINVDGEFNKLYKQLIK